MRERFNLDLPNMERMTFLFHGNYNTGKTFMLGDALRYEMSQGKRGHYINLRGEDGNLTLKNWGFGDIGEHVDTLDDLRSALLDCSKAGVDIIAVDGLKHLGKFAVRKHCGERLPSVGRGSDDWQKIHKDIEDTIGMMRWCAPLIVCASSSDRSLDQVSGEIGLTPDLPGRQAAGVGGMFDFVFVLRAQALGPTKVRWWIDTTPQNNTVTRYRLPRRLPPHIEIPEGGGGWKALKEAIHDAMDKAPAGLQGIQAALAGAKSA